MTRPSNLNDVMARLPFDESVGSIRPGAPLHERRGLAGAWAHARQSRCRRDRGVAARFV